MVLHLVSKRERKKLKKKIFHNIDNKITQKYSFLVLFKNNIESIAFKMNHTINIFDLVYIICLCLFVSYSWETGIF